MLSKNQYMFIMPENDSRMIFMREF